MYIASQDELEAFVARAATSSVLAIDTEFLREKTYYAKLCLLQMATDDEDVVIDPFGITDLSVLQPLLIDQNIMKIVHAGRQDIEILLYDVGCIPTPIFDTQIAEALLGRTQQIGYGALVHTVLGIKLKKLDSFTDWSVRPLTQSQIDYAREDVIYLPELYRVLTQELTQKGRIDWVDAEFKELTQVRHYQDDERERFRRLKHISQLSNRQMAAAREVAAWREIHARMRNVPRKWILTDEQIVEACKRESRTIDDLFLVRGIRERLTTRDAREVIELMSSALDSPADTWPQVQNCNRNEPNVDVQADMLMALVKLRAKEHDIAVQTLASHADLTALARGHYEDSEVLRGWRKQIVGDDLVRMLEGSITLGIKDGKPYLVSLER